MGGERGKDERKEGIEEKAENRSELRKIARQDWTWFVWPLIDLVSLEQLEKLTTPWSRNLPQAQEKYMFLKCSVVEVLSLFI